uniref:Protein containing Archaeal flagella protein domain protein n=1 Tax=uncultured organism TaxID=155900 RepID=M1QC14_9ZZZZ|nr:protein containing Archaeal flagella protein domain protein [uncultured organism]
MEKSSFYENELSEVSGEKKELSNPLKIEKPYLTAGNLKRGDLEKEIPTLEWLDYLLSKKEKDGLIEVLSYYIDLGWISKKARDYLMSYARGFSNRKKDKVFSEIKMNGKEYSVDKEKEEKEQGWEKNHRSHLMSPKDHIKSLYYILKIIKSDISDEKYEKVMETVQEKIGEKDYRKENPSGDVDEKESSKKKDNDK